MANELQTIRAAVKAHDDDLNRREIAPTGDDYNALFSIVMGKEGDKALDLLDDLSAAFDTVLLHHGDKMPEHDRKTRQALVNEARAFCDARLRPEEPEADAARAGGWEWDADENEWRKPDDAASDGYRYAATASHALADDARLGQSELVTGVRVRLIKAVDHGQDGYYPEGLTGKLTLIDAEGSFWVHLDDTRPELADWNNRLQIWDWSKQDGPEGHPATYLTII